MPNRIVLIFVLLFASGHVAYCQDVKNKEHLRQLWFAYSNQTRFTNKWGLWLDLHMRTKNDFVDDFSQSIVRVGLTYYVTDATKLTAGYAWVNIFPADNHKNISQPEHRAWQQIQWHTNYRRNKMMQWIRLEEKFKRKVIDNSTLGEGYDFNYKVRYNLLYEVPLSKKTPAPAPLSFIFNDELHINFGKQIVNNYFDQNRFFVGLKLQVNPRSNLQAGYMNVFQQLAAGNRYKDIHAMRFFYFHNLDFRQKK